MEEIFVKYLSEPHEKLNNYRESHGVTFTFISHKLSITPSYARKILLGILPLNNKNRAKLNELFGTNY